jgi:hypothetical protein
MKVNKRALIRWKVYLDRSKMYIGYINLFMMVTIFLGAIKNTEVGKFLIANVYIAIPILVILFIVFALILGYWDTKLGIRSEELRNLSSENPVQMEMLQTIREIKEEQKNILDKLEQLKTIS